MLQHNLNIPNVWDVMVIKIEFMSFPSLPSTLFYLFDLLVTILIWYTDLWVSYLKLVLHSF